MSFKHHHVTDSLYHRSGGGFLILFGMPFFLIGLFVLSLTFGILEVKGDNIPLPVGLIFGLVFTAVGGGFIFGRAGVKIDRHHKKLISWKRVIFPLSTHEYPFSDFNHLELREETRRTKNGSYTVYVLYMVGLKDIKLEENRSFIKVRSSSEQVAKFISMPIHDLSRGQRIVREPQYLDEPLAERIKRTGEAVEVGDPEPNFKAQYLPQDATHMKIVIPSNLIPALIPTLFSLIPLVFIFIFMAGMFSQKETPFPFTIFMGIFILIPIIGCIYTFKRFAALKEVIEITPEFLTVTSGSTTQLKVDKIEELAPPGNMSMELPKFAKMLMINRGICALTDEKELYFARNLSHTEQEYIVALIKKIFVS